MHGFGHENLINLRKNNENHENFENPRFFQHIVAQFKIPERYAHANGFCSES